MPIAERIQIDLQKMKDYLKIEYDEDDRILFDLSNTAKEFLDNFLQNDFMDRNELGELVEKPIPFSLVLAVYQIVGNWYENRTMGVKSKSIGGITYDIAQIPVETMALLYPYRKLVGT